MNELINGNAIKMTSIEIAELVESRHSNVKVSIDRLVKRGVIKPPALQHTNIINDLVLLPGSVISTSSRANKESETALSLLPSCRQSSPLVLLTVGESLKKLRLISPKRYRKRCALLLILLSRKCNWKTSSQLPHLKLSLPIALARPAEF